MKNITKPKSENNLVDERNKIEKFNDFFKRNNYAIVIMLTIMMFLTILDNRSYKAQTEKKLNEAIYYIKANLSHLGFVSASGMLITAKLEGVNYDSDRLKLIILNQLTNPFLQSGSDITFGYEKSYSSMKKMVSNNALMYDFYKFYTTKQAKNDVKKVYNTIYKFIAMNLYPEYITVEKREVTTFNIQKIPRTQLKDDKKDRNIFRFKVVVNYKVKTKNWIVQLNKWMDEEKLFTYEFNGIIDPVEYANSSNLIGFKVTRVKIPVLTKPNF